MKFKFTFFYLLIFLFPSQILLAEIPKKATCSRVVDLRTAGARNPNYKVAISAMLAASDEDWSTLAKMFNNKLRVTSKKLGLMVSRVSSGVGVVKEWTLESFWTIQNSKGRSTWLNCHSPQNLSKPDQLSEFQLLVHPGRPNYNIVVMNLKSTYPVAAKVVFSILEDGKFGFMEIFQTQLMNQTADKWLQSTKTSLEKKKLDLDRSYFGLITAFKLAKFGMYLRHPYYEDIQKQRVNNLPLEALISRYSQKMKVKNLVFVDTLFYKNMPGLLFRFQMDEDASVMSMKKLCHDALKNLLQSGFKAEEISNFQCSYMMKGEPVEEDGKFGARVVARSEIQQMITKL